LPRLVRPARVPTSSRTASPARAPRVHGASRALVLAAVVALVVSGCVAGKQATPVTGDGPTAAATLPANFDELLPSGLDPAFRTYYAQQVEWESCRGGNLVCTTVSIPVSWRDASLGSASLEVVRSPARGDRVG